MSLLSIVICTHNRFEILKLAVESLCKQTSPKTLFEVIVIDNDVKSNIDVINIVEKVKKTINIKYIHEPILGLAQARNKGGKEATAEFVGYMDDDAKAKENYVEEFAKIVANEKPDVIGGPYYAYYLSPKPDWFKDKYASKNSDGSHFLNNKEFLSGTNMIYRKPLLEMINWFDTSFGMTGETIAYGEETDLQIRLWSKKNDLKVFYSSDLIVYHLVPPHKMTLKDKFRRSYNMGKSQAYMWISNEEIKSFQKKAPLILFKTSVILIIKEIPTLFLRNLKQYPFWQNYAYEIISKYFAGIGQEWRRIKDCILRK